MIRRADAADSACPCAGCVVLCQVMRGTGVRKRRVRKHELRALRTNEDASDRPPVPRMYDDLPDEAI